ncbi:HAD-IA family hydrolase [uncultured Bosea sp.]|uniref:HAD-IA family hydrolase n=1 Tax=uncultured Bosea sp. TaxID=211457 RepID=UPI00263A90C3|nr:HAD-IA family hydrolase [uncultured Bosea sp.]
MCFKALMVDVDGVVIVHPDPQGWSAHLERDLGLSPALLQSAFFAPHWPDIILGRAGLRERLAPVLAEIAPGLSADRLIRYWFANDAHLDQGLLAQLAPIRAGGVKLHLATVQEHERARYIWDELALKRHFDGMHYAAELGCAKPDGAFYRAVAARSGLSPEEIFFIDDKQANVDAARGEGWSAALWDGTRPLVALIIEAAGRPPIPSPPP